MNKSLGENRHEILQGKKKKMTFFKPDPIRRKRLL